MTVTTHDAPTVEFVVDERRSARDAEWLERSRDILRLRTFREADGVTLTMRRQDGEWEQRRCKQCRLHANIEVRVPLIGGRAEKTVVAEVEKSWNRTAEVCRTWLRKHASTTS